MPRLIPNAEFKVGDKVWFKNWPQQDVGIVTNVIWNGDIWYYSVRNSDDFFSGEYQSKSLVKQLNGLETMLNLLP